MNSFKNPLVPLIDNPVNIDRPIQEIQIELARLTWLEKCFGRSWLAVKSSKGMFSSDKKLYYPHVWQGFDVNGKARDLLDVLPNDNLKSQSFFRVIDPISVIDYAPTGDAMMRATVDIIFWFNLRSIDRSIDYPYIELLKGQVLRTLKGVPFSPDSSLVVVNIHEQALNVFRGYNINDIKDQHLIYPYAGFRFECQITYREDCPYNAYNVPPVPDVDFLTADSTEETADITTITADNGLPD